MLTCITKCFILPAALSNCVRKQFASNSFACDKTKQVNSLPNAAPDLAGAAYCRQQLESYSARPYHDTVLYTMQSMWSYGKCSNTTWLSVSFCTQTSQVLPCAATIGWRMTG